MPVHKKTTRKRTPFFKDKDREKRFGIRSPAKKRSGTATKIVAGMNATPEA
jgi:hypothetical protein